MKKKILILAQGYLPGEKYGGPVISLSNFVAMCSDYFEFYIVTNNHDLNDNTPYPNIHTGWNHVGKAKVLYCTKKQLSYLNIKNIIIKEQPDIVYLNSFFYAKFLLPTLSIAKKTNIKVLLAPRGELFPNVLKLKSFKKKVYISIVKRKFINKNVFFQATIEDEREQIVEILEVSKNKVFTINNFPTLPNRKFVKRPKRSGYLKLIYLSRIHPQKNLDFALNCLRKIKGQVEFNLYGSLESEEYWEECRQIINNLPNNIKVRYCGNAKHEEIHEVFSQHDAMILPTISENYGHSIIESMLSGCPVIISDNTPWTDINDSKAGYAIPLSHETDYIICLQKILEMDNNEYEKMLINMKSYIEGKLEIEAQIKNYVDVFNTLANLK